MERSAAFGCSYLAMPDQQPVTTCDVTVIGGGLAGKAASLHLAKAGLKAICIDPADSRASRERVSKLFS